MKWPWTRRADEAQERADEAGRYLARVEAQWTRVRSVTCQADSHKRENGWAATIEKSFRRQA